MSSLKSGDNLFRTVSGLSKNADTVKVMQIILKLCLFILYCCRKDSVSHTTVENKLCYTLGFYHKDQLHVWLEKCQGRPENPNRLPEEEGFLCRGVGVIRGS